MTFDISCLTNGNCIPVALTKSIGVTPEYNLTEDEVTIEFLGSICKSLKYYSLDGVLKANLSFSCNKCLCLVNYPLEVSVSEKFSNVENVMATEGDNNLGNNDEFDDIFSFTGKIIDLTEALESNLFLNIPYKVICKEDCKGLCCICGHELNISDCGCQDLQQGQGDGFVNKSNNKFEALRSFFNE